MVAMCWWRKLRTMRWVSGTLSNSLYSFYWYVLNWSILWRWRTCADPASTKSHNSSLQWPTHTYATQIHCDTHGRTICAVYRFDEMLLDCWFQLENRLKIGFYRIWLALRYMYNVYAVKMMQPFTRRIIFGWAKYAKSIRQAWKTATCSNEISSEWDDNDSNRR